MSTTTSRGPGSRRSIAKGASCEPASCAAYARTVTAATSLGDAFEHHHRNVAVCLALVLVVVGPLGGHDAPQLGLLIGRGGASLGAKPLALHLHGDIRLGDEVEIPGRRLGMAALRGHDKVVVAATSVDEWRLAFFAGAPSLRREDERLGAPHPFVAFLTTRSQIAVDVLLSEKPRHSSLLQQLLWFCGQRTPAPLPDRSATLRWLQDGVRGVGGCPRRDITT